jgi:hypothetical protein
VIPGTFPAEGGAIFLFPCRPLLSNFDYIDRSGSVFAMCLVPWFATRISNEVKVRRKLVWTIASVILIGLTIALGGCGGWSQAPTAAPAPVTQNATVSGQYTLVLTSTNGRGTIDIYTNFTQTGKTFAGAADTLVCPSNDLSQCKGNDPLAASIIPAGTVSGANVTITFAISTPVGADTFSLVGSAAATTLAGTYTDTQGDTGTWTGSSGSPLTGSYGGTFNSTANPLSIAPTILISLTQDATFNLTGTGLITNLPCINSLKFSGQAIGQAFSLNDATNKAHITAVPTGSNFTFSYNFDPTAPSCAGDFGRGTLTDQDPWDY